MKVAISKKSPLSTNLNILDDLPLVGQKTSKNGRRKFRSAFQNILMDRLSACRRTKYNGTQFPPFFESLELFRFFWQNAAIGIFWKMPWIDHPRPPHRGNRCKVNSSIPSKKSAQFFPSSYKIEWKRAQKIRAPRTKAMAYSDFILLSPQSF